MKNIDSKEEAEAFNRDPQKWVYDNLPLDHPVVQAARKYGAIHNWNRDQMVSFMLMLMINALDDLLTQMPVLVAVPVPREMEDKELDLDVPLH